MKNKFEVNATIVSNEFIDRYMTSANGEYVKVYLYLARHQGREITVTEMADALNHTESDIKRAVNYWQWQGVLIQEETVQKESAIQKEPSSQKEPAVPKETGAQKKAAIENKPADSGESVPKKNLAVEEPEKTKQRPLYTPEQVSRLAEEEDFTQLLYISQKYMNKVFTPRECEVFAYLYDALKLPVELLEYLVEYCVQGGHYSIRYLETVALDWHEKKICTVDRAKQHTASFSNEAFAVMKAFGLNERRPGDAELTMIRRWFQEWGFTKELVLEACGRTLRATHTPSFSYADKILSEWKKAGVLRMEDVKNLDEKRENKKLQKQGQPVAPKTVKNQFHNFEQRNTDYDGMVLERLKQRLETP